MAASQMSSTKMIFDATALKDLLGSTKDAKKGKTIGLSSTNRPSKQSLDIIQTILKEETSKGGGVVPIKSIKSKPKKKKQSKKTRKSSILRELGPGGLLEQVRLYRLSYNNVYEYASLMNVNRSSVDYIERQYRRIKNAVNSTINKVIQGHEQLSGPDAEFITTDDVSILLSFAGASVDETAIYSLMHAHQQRTDSPEAKSEDERIPLESFLSALRTYLTLHAMTFCLGEMRGLIAKQKEILNQSSNRDLLAAAVAAGESQSDSLPLEPSLFTEFSSTLNPYVNRIEQPSTNSVFVSSVSASGRPASDPQPGVPLKVGPSRGLLHSNTTTVLNEDSQVGMQASQSQVSLGGGAAPAAGGVDTFNSSFLPPLRINKQQGSHPGMKKKALARAGFDDSFTRPTPRVLHKNTGMADIEALRWELQATQEGMKQLDKLVDNNIAWVQSHCDMSSMQSNFSSRTKQKCKNMATERIFKVYWRFSQLTTLWALQRWKIAVRYLELRAVSAKYAKIKSIDLMTNTLYEVLTRQWQKGFTPWFAQYREAKAMEQLAACVQIQRIIRGYLGRVRAQYTKIHRGSTVIQQMFRKRKAKRRVAARRAEELFKKRDRASRRIQRFMRDYTNIRRAKAEAERRRKAKAVLKIQKIQRGKSTRMSISRRVSMSIQKATTGVIEKVSDVLKISNRIKTPKSSSVKPNMDLESVAMNVAASVSKDEDSSSIGFPSRPGTVPGEEETVTNPPAGSPKPKTPGSPSLSRGPSQRNFSRSPTGLSRQPSSRIVRGPSQHIAAAAAQGTAATSISPVKGRKQSSTAAAAAAVPTGKRLAGSRRSSTTSVASGTGRTHAAKNPVSKSFNAAHKSVPAAHGATAGAASVSVETDQPEVHPVTAAAAAAAEAVASPKSRAPSRPASRPSSTGIALMVPPDEAEAVPQGALSPQMADVAATVVAVQQAANPRSSAGRSRVTKGGVTKNVEGSSTSTGRRSAGNSRTSVSATPEDGISAKALAEHNKLHGKHGHTKRNDEDGASVASSTAGRSVKSNRSHQQPTQRRSAGTTRPPAKEEKNAELPSPSKTTDSPSRSRASRRSLTNDEIANARQISSPSSGAQRTQRRSFDGEVSLRKVLSGDKADAVDTPGTPGTPSSIASRPTRASLDLSSRRQPAAASPSNRSIHSLHSSSKSSASTSTYRSAASSKKHPTNKTAATNIQKIARGKIARAQSKKLIEAKKMQSERGLDTGSSADTPVDEVVDAAAAPTVEQETPAQEALVIDTTPPADDKLAPLNSRHSRLNTPDAVARDQRPRTCSPSRIIGALLSPVRPLTSSSFFKNAFVNPLGEWLHSPNRPKTSASASGDAAAEEPALAEEHARAHEAATAQATVPLTASQQKPASPPVTNPTASSLVPPLVNQKSQLSDGPAPALAHQQSHLSTQSILEAVDTLTDLPMDVIQRSMKLDHPIAEEAYEDYSKPDNASPADNSSQSGSQPSSARASRPTSAKVSNASRPPSGSVKATPPSSARGGAAGASGSVKNSAGGSSIKASGASSKASHSPGKAAPVSGSTKGKSAKHQPSSGTSTKAPTGSSKVSSSAKHSSVASSSSKAPSVVSDTPFATEDHESIGSMEQILEEQKGFDEETNEAAAAAASVPEGDFVEVTSEPVLDVFDVPPSAEEDYEQQVPEPIAETAVPVAATEEAVPASAAPAVAAPEKLRSRPSSQQNVHSNRPTPPHTPHHHHDSKPHTPHHDKPHTPHDKPHTPHGTHGHSHGDHKTDHKTDHKGDPSARKASTTHQTSHSQHSDGHKATPSKSSDKLTHHTTHGSGGSDHKHDHASTSKTTKTGKKDAKKAVKTSTSAKAAQLKVPKDAQTEAVERIQTMMRIKLARIRANKQRKVISKAEEDARNLIIWSVVTIQRVARGKIGQKKFRTIYEAKKAQLEASKQKAATLIQTRARGMRDRTRVKGIQKMIKDQREEEEWLKSYQNKTPNKFSKPTATASPATKPAVAEESKSIKDNSPSLKGGSTKSPSTKSPAVRGSSASSKSKKSSTSGGKSAKHHAVTENEDDPEEQSTVMDTSDTLPTIDATTHERGSNAASAAATTSAAPSGVLTAKERELEEKLKRLELLEKENEERLAAMKAQELKVAEQQKAIQDALDMMAQRAKADEAERAQREMLLQLAQGAISHRSEYASTGPRSAREAAAGQRSPGGEYLTREALNTLNKSARGSNKYSARSQPASARNHDAPPTARSARGGAGIPPDARRMMHGGEEWVQLWDPEEAAYYWYCERTQFAQWETPGGDFDDQESRPDSGYESAGAMTDYSTDYNSEFGGEYTDSEYGDGNEWHEYWDEAAQAKYWYNNNTGEASWTKPAEISSRGHTAAIAETYSGSNYGSNASGQAPFDNPNDWAEFIDEETGQGYWYNSKTGQSSWV